MALTLTLSQGERGPIGEYWRVSPTCTINFESIIAGYFKSLNAARHLGRLPLPPGEGWGEGAFALCWLLLFRTHNQSGFSDH